MEWKQIQQRLIIAFLTLHYFSIFRALCIAEKGIGYKGIRASQNYTYLRGSNHFLKMIGPYIIIAVRVSANFSRGAPFQPPFKFKELCLKYLMHEVYDRKSKARRSYVTLSKPFKKQNNEFCINQEIDKPCEKNCFDPPTPQIDLSAYYTTVGE